VPEVSIPRMDFKPEAAEDACHRIFAFFGQYLR
jgi:dienelactone hydrolase